MLCLTTDESFQAFETRYMPQQRVKAGPKIHGNSWAARQEAKMWRDIEEKKRRKATKDSNDA